MQESRTARPARPRRSRRFRGFRARSRGCRAGTRGSVLLQPYCGDIMEYSPPQQPTESGRLDGLAWCLWLPPGEGPWPAVIVLHGAGSRKENHADYARATVAQGLAALTFDN